MSSTVVGGLQLLLEVFGKGSKYVWINLSWEKQALAEQGWILTTTDSALCHCKQTPVWKSIVGEINEQAF